MSEKSTAACQGTKRFVSHSEYRPCSVENLGHIPAHWDVCPLRHKLVSRPDGIKIGPFGSDLKLEHMVRGGFKVYGQEHVISADFSRGEKYINQQKFSELRQCEIKAGDLLVTMMGTSGRCSVVPYGIERGVMDSHLLRVRVPETQLDPRFVALVLDQAPYVKDQINSTGKGAIMHGLNSDIVKSLILAVPPTLQEQRSIADFLDRETARIDVLVAKKERLIELLQEKRTALITQAVTKGLDPDVPMKDSGLDWIGKIPEHWKVTRLKFACTEIGDGDHTPPPRVLDGIPYITAKGIKDGCISYDECSYVAVDYAGNSQAKAGVRGACLVSCVGSLGEVARVRPTDPQVFLDRDIIYLRTDTENLLPEYLFLLLRGDVFQEQVKLWARGSAQGHIYLGQVRNGILAIPEHGEQRAITEYLDRETAKIDPLIAKIRQAISLLKEYRTALISAAVTGKIDVRHQD